MCLSKFVILFLLLDVYKHVVLNGRHNLFDTRVRVYMYTHQQEGICFLAQLQMPSRQTHTQSQFLICIHLSNTTHYITLRHTPSFVYLLFVSLLLLGPLEPDQH